MKKLYTLIAALFITAISLAQSPSKISYQAIIRDVNNNLLTNQSIGTQISILQGSSSGTAVYIETQNASTNMNGLVTLEIGTGTPVSGDFSTIDWGADTFFLKIETDPSGGNNYTITGTSQMLSVPYALYAKSSGSSTPGPQGPAGLDGADGLDGATGAMGPQGPAGSDGADGLDGATGPMGPQGPAGLDGADGLDGATGPMGPQGPAGLDGADGLDGATGPMGPQGPAGLDGADGLDGATGPMGPQGPAGLDGADGLDGATGPMGPQGPAGLDGATGPQGPQGPAGSYTAGTGISISGSVISATGGSSTTPEYAYAYIANSSTLGPQTLTSMFPASTYVNGVVMNGSSITLHANKMYEVTVAFYIYNATGGHTFKMKDATNSQYLGTEIYFGQGGSDVSYNMSTTNFLYKPTTDVNLELEKTQGTDVNLIGKIVVKEIK
ncbi:hypothetical protein ACFSKN_04315 [Mariniflexile gromovii]|uniref:Collagen triple helix repeat protein n=1 Tax=Mariniflexile gromovii TaxID=362523 RepID=A0ABS4BUW0_9FLAO|nr:hypothetical protein [Mariniflexile gromovii]MBP0903791.1 hypothetical protein [Mariniflexile gromovii]